MQTSFSILFYFISFFSSKWWIDIAFYIWIKWFIHFNFWFLAWNISTSRHEFDANINLSYDFCVFITIWISFVRWPKVWKEEENKNLWKSSRNKYRMMHIMHYTRKAASIFGVHYVHDAFFFVCVCGNDIDSWHFGKQAMNDSSF